MSETGGTVRRLAEMLPSEAEAYFAGGGDLAIIPIGSIEQHGPHLLTGCDGYITLAKAREIARLSGGVLFPMIEYCWEGVTNVFSGGIGVRERVFIDYLRAVVRAVRRAGSTRILIVNSHGGNYYAMRSFPQQCLREDGIVVMTIYGRAGCPAPEKGAGETAMLLGALHLLGRDDLVENIVRYTKAAIEEFGDRPEAPMEPECVREIRRFGEVGFEYWSECVHVQPDSGQLDGGGGADFITKIAEHVTRHVGALSQHTRDTEGWRGD
ncbi:MAG: creatininase family protein [Planctomycetota bacterium]